MNLLTTLISICIFIVGTNYNSYAQASPSDTILWSIAGNGSGGVTDDNTTVTVVEGVSGPDGSDFNSGVNGLDSFVVGGSYTAGDHFKLKTSGDTNQNFDYSKDYIEFTITADPGYALNLSSLDFDSARGGDSGTRGFKIYGKVQGAPLDTDNLLDIDNEAGTRTTPSNRSIDLSASQYDEVYSITFRYYPSVTNGSVEFNNLNLIGSVFPSDTPVETGYDLWLRYPAISNTDLLLDYRSNASEIVVEGSSDTLTAISTELNKGLDGLLDKDVPNSASVTQDGAVIVGTPASSSIISALGWGSELDAVGEEGFLIKSATINGKSITVIASNGEVGALYGTFNFLRLIQTNQSLSTLNISESPKIKHRMLNHWDWDKDNNQNLVERGYAGESIWNWDDLPAIVDPRYTDYARANASIGINGVVLNNVNAQPLILSAEYLEKVAALADVFRPYGIKVYLTARYDAPMHSDSDVIISSANSTLPEVKTWWENKVEEIYNTYITDFGGFLMKVDSEGQPGPSTNYGLNHAEGANPIADALDTYGGLLIWRTFVHDKSLDDDRVKRPYKQFTPLDGEFRDNVILQAKNGPFDFQPREPIHPLFGAMPNTAMGMEFQITQEYLGHSTHLVYNAPMWKEILDFDTYANGADSTVAKIVDGSLDSRDLSMIAGVANIGSDTNWCGHHFAQANWYAYGRLAWDHQLSSEGIADEWIRMTWSNDSDVRTDLSSMMLPSWEAAVNYMTPLGLAFTVSGSDFTPSHYYPQPSKRDGKYWFSDSSGLGYDRTTSGSDAVGQYSTEVETLFNSLSDCPEKHLLWFHKVSWNHTMDSGRTMWEELCYKFNYGVQHINNMQTTWDSLNEKIDFRRFGEVQAKLSTHLSDATDFKDTYIDYFQSDNGLDIPSFPSSNQSPSFSSDTITEANATVDSVYSGSVASATDPDDDTLTYSKVSGPAWLTVDADGSLSGTPGQSDVGANAFTVKADDGNGGTDTATLNVTVSDSQVNTNILWGIAGNSSAGNNVGDANTTVTLTNGVSGPDGSDLNDATNGINSFVVGGTYTAGNHFKTKLASSKTSIVYGSDYIEFTIAAESGYRLNLSSLDFDSARGGSSGTRGFEIYAAVGATPTLDDLLFDIDNESGTRDLPVNHNIDLAANEYQGIQSVTFRYYPLVTNGSVEFNNLNLIGTVSPKNVEFATLDYIASTGGSIGGITSEDVLVGESSSIITATPSSTYNFVNWTDSSNNIVTTSANLQINNVSASETYTANFVKKQYTVTFVLGDATLINGDLIQDVFHGEAATAPTVAAPVGQSFTGWSTSFTNVISDLTVTALYESKQLQLSSLTMSNPSSHTLGWTALDNTAYYYLAVGTSEGMDDLYGMYLDSDVTTVDLNLSGYENVYVRLWTYANGEWHIEDSVITDPNFAPANASFTSYTGDASELTIKWNRSTYDGWYYIQLVNKFTLEVEWSDYFARTSAEALVGAVSQPLDYYEVHIWSYDMNLAQWNQDIKDLATSENQTATYASHSLDGTSLTLNWNQSNYLGWYYIELVRISDGAFIDGSYFDWNVSSGIFDITGTLVDDIRVRIWTYNSDLGEWDSSQNDLSTP